MIAQSDVKVEIVMQPVRVETRTVKVEMTPRQAAAIAAMLAHTLDDAAVFDGELSAALRNLASAAGVDWCAMSGHIKAENNAVVILATFPEVP